MSLGGVGEMARVFGSHSYFMEHLRSYRVRPPFWVEENHLKRIQQWEEELREWAISHNVDIQIHRKPLGDPHSPNGVRASRLIIGPYGKQAAVCTKYSR